MLLKLKLEYINMEILYTVYNIEYVIFKKINDTLLFEYYITSKVIL